MQIGIGALSFFSEFSSMGLRFDAKFLRSSRIIYVLPGGSSDPPDLPWLRDCYHIYSHTIRGIMLSPFLSLCIEPWTMLSEQWRSQEFICGGRRGGLTFKWGGGLKLRSSDRVSGTLCASDWGPGTA